MANRNWWPMPPRRVGDRWQYGSLTFWPDGGGVYVTDQDPRPDDPLPAVSMTLPKWMARIAAQRGYLKAAQQDAHIGTPDEVRYKAQHVRAITGLVEAMLDVARRAHAQGDLTQAAVQKYYRDHVAPVRQTHLVPGTILP